MELIRVMIVDDDRLSVNYMVDLIDWEACGYTIVGTAYHGRQAWNMFPKCSPDLLITDITMPLMNGIELVTEVKKQYPDTRTILLTAYSEFEYARAAVSTGVDYYIIKDEMTAQVLQEKLASIRKTIGNIKHISGLFFQKALADFFSDKGSLVMDSYHNAEIEAFMQRDHCCILVETNQDWYPFERHKTNNAAIGTVLSTVMERIGEINISQYGVIPNGSLLLFLKEKNGIQAYERYQMVNHICDRLVSSLNETCQGRYTVYHLGATVQLPVLKDVIDTQLPRYAWFHGSGKSYCIGVADSKQMDRNEKAELWEVTEGRIRSYLEEQDQEGLLAYIRQCLDRKQNPLDCLWNQVQELTRITELLVKGRGMNPEEFFESAELYDLGEIQQWFLHGYQKLFARITAGNIRLDVKKAAAYVRENYWREDLSIAELANYVGISNSRLSVIFKQDMQVTVNQYITKVRVEKAKELLSTGSYKVYEVAQKVGYGTSQYLSRIFYRETGRYPADYKREG